MEKNDSSIELLEKYFRLADKKLTINLKNNISYTGYIVGYSYEDMDSESRSVIMWNFLEEHMVDENPLNDIDDSVFIYHKNIRSVYFFDNDATVFMPEEPQKRGYKFNFKFSFFRRKEKM
jgi:hypothetical protein